MKWNGCIGVRLELFVAAAGWMTFDVRTGSYYCIRVNKETGIVPNMSSAYEKDTIDFWFKLAPKLDRAITSVKASGKAPMVSPSALSTFSYTYNR